MSNLGSISNSDLVAELMRRIATSKPVDADAVVSAVALSNPAASGQIQASGIFNPRPDGKRPILDAIAGWLNDPAIRQLLMNLILQWLGGAGASHAPVAERPVE